MTFSAGSYTTDVAKVPHGSASVSGSASVVAEANENRVRLYLGNDHASQLIYLSLGGTAEVSKGIRINAAGGQFPLKGYTGAVSAIATGAGTTLLVSEVGSDGLINLCTNPDAAVDTTGWSNLGAVTFERVTSLPTLSGLPAGVTTGFHCVGNGSGDGGRTDVAVEAGKTYRLSAYLYLDSNTATGIRLQIRDAAGNIEATTLPSLSTLDAWTRINLSVTADETATWQFRVGHQEGPGNTDFYFTRVVVLKSRQCNAQRRRLRHRVRQIG